MDNTPDTTGTATLDQFDYWSRAIAEFFRRFGEPERIKSDLHDIANFGADATLFMEPWADKIVLVRDGQQPVRIRPWKDDPDKEIVGRCANLCGAWLLGACWTIIFKEMPPFAKIKDVAAQYGALERFFDEHLDDLTKRIRFVEESKNYTEWLTLAEAMEIERVRLMHEHKRSGPPKRKLSVNQTACIAILDGHKIDLRPNSAKALALLISRDGEFVSLADNDLRTRDIDALPLALKELVETQPGAGTRILRDKVEMA